MRVNGLKDRKVQQIASGEANYALCQNGDLYVWGKYNQSVIWQPMRILDQSSLVSIKQSLSGLTAAIDTFQRLWLW